MRVLSLGAGVQSSTLALMIEKGEVPMVDAAIFADTKSEQKAVYDWLNWLEAQLSYPVYRVSWRNLKQDILDASQGNYKAFTAPFFTLNVGTGKKGLLRRQCTGDYKIKPIVQKVRELLGLEKGQMRKKGTKVEMLMGISIDEIVRIKPNQIKYISNIYPLVEKGMSRSDCKAWMGKHNHPEPPRSACTFCPYHSNEEWQNVKQNKKEWEEVVKLDLAIRSQEKFKTNKYNLDELYLHRSCKPISEIDFNEDKSRQLDLFAEECAGICGV
tara:strand:+ start:232 stop:1041 length:810 start_codon:yes stop_codon:yes gene_type:complete